MSARIRNETSCSRSSSLRGDIWRISYGATNHIAGCSKGRAAKAAQAEATAHFAELLPAMLNEVFG